jgi:hypothetical protein
LWRLIGAALLAYVFILVLITASLQASVSDRLAAMSEPLDYSSGNLLWQEAGASDAELRELRVNMKDTIGQLRFEEELQRKLRQDWDEEIETLGNLLARLHPVPGCASASPTAALSVIGGLSDLRACVEQARLTPAQRAEASEILNRADSIRGLDKTYQAAGTETARLERELTEMRARAVSIKKDQERFRAVRNSFAELEAFRGGRLVGSAVLTDFPPAVVQILLAFVSGLFGALLVTLVLVVYPQSSLKLSSGGGTYGARIMLGGLISICVFVVIGGGTAVLGTAGSFAEGEANFLAFCAIGVLSGMFSDRVAHWLSERADTFFSQKDRGEVAGAAQRPRGAAAPDPTAATPSP